MVAFIFLRTQRIERISVGQFAAVMGAPKVHHAGDSSPLTPHPSTIIFLGDRIETGDGDKADIKFNDGTTVRLNFNTRLEIPNPKSEIRNPKSPPSRPSGVKEFSQRRDLTISFALGGTIGLRR